MMTPEDSQCLGACLLEAVEILYRNTPTEEMTNFESLEKALRTKMLEQVNPKIAVFLSNKSQVHKQVEKKSSRASWER